MALMSRSLVAALASAVSEPICASNSESRRCSSALKRLSVSRVLPGLALGLPRSRQPSLLARAASACLVIPASAAIAVTGSIPVSYRSRTRAHEAAGAGCSPAPLIVLPICGVCPFLAGRARAVKDYIPSAGFFFCP